MKINKADIVEAALAELDEKGLEKLSMRGVARRLHVQGSALYWHVGDKSELLALMAKTFYLDAAYLSEIDGNWREWLIGFGQRLRRKLLAHRDAARLCATANVMTPDVDDRAQQLMEPLMRIGLSEHRALSYPSSVVALVLGWTVVEQSNDRPMYLASLVAIEDSFNDGLFAMVAGFTDGVHH